MTENAQRVLAALRAGSATMRIVDIRHATGLVTSEVREALAYLCSQRIVKTTSWGMRYALRDRNSFCPPAAPPANNSGLASDTDGSQQASYESALCTLDHTAQTCFSEPSVNFRKQ